MGFLFFQLDANLVGVRSRAGVIYMLALTQFLFAMLGTLNVFITEKPVFLRECLDRLYSPAQLYLSKVVVDVPMQAFYAGLIGCIVYPLVGLNDNSAYNFLMFEVVLMAMANCGSAVGFAVSCKAPSIGAVSWLRSILIFSL